MAGDVSAHAGHSAGLRFSRRASTRLWVARACGSEACRSPCTFGKRKSSRRPAKSGPVLTAPLSTAVSTTTNTHIEALGPDPSRRAGNRDLDLPRPHTKPHFRPLVAQIRPRDSAFDAEMPFRGGSRCSCCSSRSSSKTHLSWHRLASVSIGCRVCRIADREVFRVHRPPRRCQPFRPGSQLRGTSPAGTKWQVERCDR